MNTINTEKILIRIRDKSLKNLPIQIEINYQNRIGNTSSNRITIYKLNFLRPETFRDCDLHVHFYQTDQELQVVIGRDNTLTLTSSDTNSPILEFYIEFYKNSKLIARSNSIIISLENPDNNKNSILDDSEFKDDSLNSLFTDGYLSKILPYYQE